MKKILIVSHEFPPDVGGAGIVAYQNATELSKKGYDVTVVTKKKFNSKEIGFKVITINKFIRKLWFIGYYLAIKENKYDLLIFNDVGAIYTAGLFFSDNVLKKE